MRLTEITYPDARPIDGYGPGFFRVAGAIHQGAVLIARGGVRGWGGLDDIAALEACNALDVLLVGTGPQMLPLPRALRDSADAVGLGLEPMATPTACRTYNVLLSEGRRVGAALLPV